MSASAAFDFGGLDIDPAFRETIFAHFREKFGRMVRLFNLTLSKRLRHWR
jgi:hypothetical protein